MGSPFGIVSLIFGIIGLVAGWLLVFIFPIIGFAIPAIAIIFGIIGIASDDSKGLGIAGLILGIIALIIGLVGYLFLRALLTAILGGLGL